MLKLAWAGSDVAEGTDMIMQYIWGMVPYCFIGAMTCIVFRVLYHKKTKTKMVWKREVVIILFAVYGAGLASQTIMPHWDAGINSGTGRNNDQYNCRDISVFYWEK